MRHTLAVLVCSAMTVSGAALAITAASGAAPVESCRYAAPDQHSRNPQDLDHDLKTDSLVGVPDADVGAAAQAGVIDVRLSRSGNSQRVGEDYFGRTPLAGDHFGTSVSYVDVNGDYCRDLVIGAPGRGNGRGSVLVVLGGVDGLRTDGAYQLAGATAGEHFGSSIAVSGANLYVGAPDRTIDGQHNAGAIYHYRVDDGQPSLVSTITEDSRGVPGTAEAGDHFGSVLKAQDSSLLVGEPDEDIAGARNAGSVTGLDLFPNGKVESSFLLAQGYRGAAGTPQTGARFGSSLAYWQDSRTQEQYLAVGVPGMNIGRAKTAGAVQKYDDAFARDTSDALRQPRAQDLVSQDSPGVAGISETGDEFGASLVAGNFFGGADLAIGVPGEDLNDARDVGGVVFTSITPGVPPANPNYRHAWYLGPPGHGFLGNEPVAGDRLGATLAALDPTVDYSGATTPANDTLAMGVPGEDFDSMVNSGSVMQLLFSSEALQVDHYGDSAGATAGEHYGGSLGRSDPTTWLDLHG